MMTKRLTAEPFEPLLAIAANNGFQYMQQP